TKAYASHLAESKYFGKPCGLMDQSAIALGGVSYIDFKDTTAPVVESIPWQFENVDIVLVNCGGDHCGLTDQYASIRTEMEGVAGIFGQKVLRFVNKDKFISSIPIIQSDISGRAILRALHYFNENDRVDNCAEAIKKIDIDSYYKMINASGDSSYKLLQNCYPEGDRDMRIPMALALSSNICCGKGAIRVHGGGFAGTMIAYVPTDITGALVKDLKAVFGADNVFEISIRNSGTRQIEI
ncbi:MAG: galactokinase, partial [Clostridia bacterium]|nr:galactokinase [Clostridia bacterium]